MRGLMMDCQLTIPAILRRAERFHGSVEIVSRQADTSIHRYRYADMIKRAKRLAVGLKQLGIGRGDRIATLAWNHHQHLESYFAVASVGAVLHTLNPRLHPNDLTYIINHAEDRFIFVDRSLLAVFEQCRSRVAVDRVVVMGGGPQVEKVAERRGAQGPRQRSDPSGRWGPASKNDRPDEAMELEALIAGADSELFVYDDIDEHDAAAMCYTSGTTGVPKGALYSHRAIVLQGLTWMVADLVGIRQRDVILPVVPMFHINAWCLPYAAVMVGAKLVLPERHLDPASLLELIASERVTLSAGAPAVWLAVLQELDRQRSDDRQGSDPGTGGRPLQTLEKLVIGGSAAPKVLVQGFQERYGVTVLQAWGMTETTSLGTVCPAPADSDSPDAPYTSRTRQGVPTPFVEIRARGDAGLVPWDDETMGELEVRGPTVASGYYKAPEGTSCVTDDGWFRTGDIVTIDARGSVQLRDRSKDLIKSGSEWISSVALENALMGHPAVAEAAVIAVPHPRWDERPLACVVLKPGGTATAEELREYLAPDFAKWWLPDAIEFVDHIPRTSTGKFLKSALRERFKNYRLPI